MNGYSELETLITEYLEKATLALELLEEHLGQTDPPLEAWHSGRWPRQGKSADGLQWEFHGSGCRVSFDSTSIDLDISPEGWTQEFDPWRIWQFIQDNEVKYSALASLEAVRSGFEFLQIQGKLQFLRERHRYRLIIESQSSIEA